MLSHPVQPPRSARRFPRRYATQLLSLLLLVGLIGCNASEHIDAGHEEEPSAAVTVWSDRHEIFAEYTLPVVGAPSRFATHVSEIATGRPRRAGGVAYRFRSSSGQTFEVVDEQPARDGIYVTDVNYPDSGDWTLVLAIGPGDDVDLIEIGTITAFESEAERDLTPAADEADGIAYLKEQQWLFGTLTTQVGRRTLQQWISAPGYVHAAPDHRAEVVPPLAGRLLAPDSGRLPALGQRVEADEVIAWIQPPMSAGLINAVEAEADLARAEVALERARVALDRTRLLHSQQARSERELQDAEFTERDALAARDGAHKVLAAYATAGIVTSGGGPPRYAVRSPIGGIIDVIGAVEGQYVPVDVPIVVVIETDHVHAEAAVRDEDLDSIDRTGVPRLLRRTQRGLEAVTTLGGGRLVHVGREVDLAHARAPVDYEFDNPGNGLRPGTALEVLIPTSISEQALAVPTSALIEDEGLTVVFVQLGGETFERRVVKTGLADGDWTEIRSGLAQGERVVSTGAYAVRLASVSSSAPAHGHAH